MLASADIRGIYTDLTEDELRVFFEDAEHCVCFAACKPGQSSHPANKLKHGIWTYHLIEALNANASGALEKGHLLTSSSLQNHLSIQVPRSLRLMVTGTQVQTPWVYGALSSDFLIADVAPILEKRKVAANPNAKQLRRVRLYDERVLPVRRLSGFKKTHHVPDSVNSATESFVAQIAEMDVIGDIDKVRDALRTEFNFKRKDLDAQVSAGTGSIITPYFDYEVIVALKPDIPSEVIWQRQVVNIRQPDKILTEKFDKVFHGMFDTLEFSSVKVIDIGAIVDQIEDLYDDRITVDFDMSLSWCTIKVEGNDSTIRITPEVISIVQSLGKSPKLLIESFFEVQKKLIDTHQIKQLPFGDSAKGK